MTFPGIESNTLQQILDHCQDDTARDLPRAKVHQVALSDGWKMRVVCEFTIAIYREFLITELEITAAAFPMAIVSMVDLHFRNALREIREGAINLKLLEPVVK